MGFGNGRTLEIREIKYTKNGYINALVRGFSRQNDEFCNDFSGWVFFLGDADIKAKEKVLKVGDFIKPRDINVTNKFENGVVRNTYFCYSFDFLHENDGGDKFKAQSNRNPIPL